MPPARRTRSSSSPLQLRVTLLDVAPPIWRLLLVPGDATLAQLHEIVQVAMGWEDDHLHAFRIGKVRYGTADDPDLGEREVDEATVTVAEAFGKHQKGFYDYDFGDSWEHELVREETTTSSAPLRFAVCLDGSRACPPEDSGGSFGYASLLEALADPDHEEHEEYLEWAGEEFDPEAFDLARVNAALQHLR